ncbi:hypothetical protein [Candidatus Mycobacterium methanotrophicum]|uniref:Ribbon-helix-helix protein CopG domain-containing protein n=1 Tax=Candidatus Mycobacterium methanotrophicum TaxID=2943498 RepID=A0ABY4QTT9_9MYCO|nr:hypothetical protein [Candidatus Mycobacterium methanotrophicum]UQX13530.1 hypothetical protein M5I08_25390 [Candidatus Mycobacterium methanotrophicum]
MAKKGVFVDGLDDIDEIMPPPIPRPDDEPAEQESIASTDVGEAQRSAAVTSPAPPRRRRVAVSVPTAEVAPNIYRHLRRLTTKEKSRDPITARTYAQVVLDAIEAHQDALSTYWTTQDAAGGGGGLFSRRPAAPARRRRHAEPPARVPLTGLNPTDAKVLDDLVGRWSAPSRSALVEQALRLYLEG